GDHVVVAGGGRNNELAFLRRLHGLDGISEQVQQNLLNLHLVDKDEIDGGVELKPHTNALILGSDQRQGARFLNELLDAFDPTLAVPPPPQFPHPPPPLPPPHTLPP